jgi:hypothetical protein
MPTVGDLRRRLAKARSETLAVADLARSPALRKLLKDESIVIVVCHSNDWSRGAQEKEFRVFLVLKSSESSVCPSTVAELRKQTAATDSSHTVQLVVKDPRLQEMLEWENQKTNTLRRKKLVILDFMESSSAVDSTKQEFKFFLDFQEDSFDPTTE